MHIYIPKLMSLSSTCINMLYITISKIQPGQRADGVNNNLVQAIVPAICPPTQTPLVFKGCGVEIKSHQCVDVNVFLCKYMCQKCYTTLVPLLLLQIIQIYMKILSTFTNKNWFEVSKCQTLLLGLVNWLNLNTSTFALVNIFVLLV